MLVRLLCSARIIKNIRMCDVPIVGIKDLKRKQGWILWGLFSPVVLAANNRKVGSVTFYCLSQHSQRDLNCVSGRIYWCQNCTQSRRFPPCRKRSMLEGLSDQLIKKLTYTQFSSKNPSVLRIKILTVAFRKKS